MNNLKVLYKTKTNLISKFISQDNVQDLSKKTFLQKIFSSSPEQIDVYFHNGILDEESISNIKKSKLTIVNSKTLRDKIKKIDGLENKNIEFIYPSLELEYKKSKEIKKEFCEKFGINPKNKLILFSAKNFKTSGIKEFLSIVSSLSNDNFNIIISGDKKQITNLKFQIPKISTVEHITLLEDYKDNDELFLISDIFILPTSNESFAINVLKAMYCKCAVFTTSINHSIELLDTFATMEEPNDRSMTFKLDALLLGIDDLKLIKKQNRKMAKNYTLENNLARLKELIENI